eukprot:jgi/Chlat1/2813/Chrsp187S02970
MLACGSLRMANFALSPKTTANIHLFETRCKESDKLLPALVAPDQAQLGAAPVLIFSLTARFHCSFSLSAFRIRPALLNAELPLSQPDAEAKRKHVLNATNGPELSALGGKAC